VGKGSSASVFPSLMLPPPLKIVGERGGPSSECGGGVSRLDLADAPSGEDLLPLLFFLACER